MLTVIFSLLKTMDFLGKNANIWHQLFYNSISVIDDITKTAKDFKKTHNLTQCTF